MSKKHATSHGLMKKAEILLSILAYMLGGDHEDLLPEHDEVLRYVRIKPPSEHEGYFDGEFFERQVLHEAKKMYRRAFRRIKEELE